ncbi:MAG TPA: DUF4398 domain-containing protein [Arenimonas sp.]|nr:DUF4398 domain-containing protein [Arenimonas sp.]
MTFRLYQQLLFLLLSFALIQSINSASAQSIDASAVDNPIQKAQKALQTAEAANAQTLASDCYFIAQDAINQALESQSKHKQKDAKRWAEKSIRYAQLATHEARYSLLKTEMDNKVSENAQLRRSLLLVTPEARQ